ncbi:MAG TPA: twin-arginine translocase TatA/TatE family subunit [Candidatus Acidoferrales bacterium]|nr:twin-arginine translocase TatA/TatE family subunit [Candidatus Acidoferrales bacterium]
MKLEIDMNTMIAAFLGGWEWIVVVLAVLLLFGAKKIPELARGLGTGIKEFKKATREVTDEIQNATEDKPQPQQPKSIADVPSQPAQTVSQSSNPPKV